MNYSSAMGQAVPSPWAVRRFEAGHKFSVFLISGMLSAAIPLVLSLYWVAFWLAPETMGTPLRLAAVACSMLLGLFWYRAPLTHAEVLLFRVLAIVAVLWLIPALLATDRTHALAGWAKTLILFSICCFAARGLRHQWTAQIFGWALLTGALLLSFFILFIYVKSLGFTLPTYKAAREFKGVAQIGGMPLNSIAFAAVFSYLMGVCLVRPTWKVLLLGVPLLLISSIFTGSRAPIAIMAASVFVLICVNGIRSGSLWLRAGTVLLVLAAIVSVIAAAYLVPDSEMNHATEGRSHLWSVGMHKFAERPLFGFGYESWRDDLVSRLPGEHELTFDLAKSLGGGYHNEYVSVLAEEGLIGAIAAVLLIWLLLRCSWLLSFRRWATTHSEQWPLFAALFLLLRANFEVPGLFGYGQDPVDYLAYLFLAIILSRFSVEEDYAARVAQRSE